MTMIEDAMLCLYIADKILIITYTLCIEHKYYLDVPLDKMSKGTSAANLALL